MTIGIAVAGPGAVRAALAGLAAVEAVGRGAIGGFVSLAGLTSDGRIARAETQRGGSRALPFEALEPALAGARLAVLMSSGPDRPEPLAQFTPADPALGLLTGHRLPNMPGPDGQPPNLRVLDLLKAGLDPAAAIRQALAVDPEADAGLILLTPSGEIALGNSSRVGRRDDIGRASRRDPHSGLRIGVLHNSIFPREALAALAVSAAIDAVAPVDCCDCEAPVLGHRVDVGSARLLRIDAARRVTAIEVPTPDWTLPHWEGSVVQRGDPVLCDGRLVGRITREVYCILDHGEITGSRGETHFGWRHVGRETHG